MRYYSLVIRKRGEETHRTNEMNVHNIIRLLLILIIISRWTHIYIEQQCRFLSFSHLNGFFCRSYDLHSID